MEFQELMTQYDKHYQIVKLRVEQGKTYREISEIYHISNARAVQKYRLFLRRLSEAYVKYITEKTEDANFQSHIKDVRDFYWNNLYVIAYLEEKYKDILYDYRRGEPPIFAIKIPKFRKISSSTKKKIEMAKDIEKKTFIRIAQELDLTKEKVEKIYYKMDCFG